MSPVPLLIAAAMASALATIAADWRVRRPAFYLFKPLTTALIIALAFAALPPVAGYRDFMLAGLGLCLVGDVLLMSRRTAAFVGGLVAFLAAHLLFAVAFTADRAAGVSSPQVFALLAVLLVFGSLLHPLLRRVRDGLRLPVIAYVVVLGTMVFAAAGKALSLGGIGPWLLCAGALLFALSDAVLAWRKFVRAPRWGQPVTLVTYYLAIGLFACAY